MFNSLKIFLLILFCFAQYFVNAQKVGLVLSGGGAKGFAHIGVIKLLEENNIPIDYIAGTSMGAIIAGFYAIGYTPKQIEDIANSDEIQEWAFGKIDEKYLYYFKKKEDNASMIELNFSFDTILRAKLPTNIIPSNCIDFNFLELFTKASAICKYNFDSLFVPFRCVAADVYDNKSIIFSKGDLSSSIRASMTFPFYFRPISINGKVLFDGGIYNNFPSDVLIKSFHPDVIIGSKVAFNSSPTKEDDLLLQIENMLSDETNFSLSKDSGILIEPVVKDVGLMDLYKSKEMIQSGYDAAKLKIDDIKKLVSRRIDSTNLSNKRNNFTKNNKALIFKDIYITGLNSHQTKYLINNIKQKRDTFNIDQLRTEFYKIIGDDQIDYIYPTAKYNETSGYYDLYLDVRKEKRFKAMIGGNISSTSLNEGFLGLEYKYLGTRGINIRANTYLGKFYSSVSIKGRIDYYNQLPFFIDIGFIHNKWDYYSSNNELFFEDVRPSYIIRNETNLQANIGLPVSTNIKFVVGGAISDMRDKYYQTIHFLKADTADQTDFYLYTGNLCLEKKTLNRIMYPNTGSLYSLRLRYIQGNEITRPGTTSLLRTEFKKNHEWIQANLIIDKYIKIHKKFTIGTYFEFVYSNKSFFNNYTSTIIMTPAFTPTPHSNTLFIENYRADIYGAGGIKIIYSIIKNFDFRIETYLFQPYQRILKNNEDKAYYGKALDMRYFMGTSALVYNTPIGPVSLSLNYYDKEESKFYFIFNIGYIFFNKRGID